MTLDAEPARDGIMVVVNVFLVTAVVALSCHAVSERRLAFQLGVRGGRCCNKTLRPESSALAWGFPLSHCLYVCSGSGEIISPFWAILFSYKCCDKELQAVLFIKTCLA